MRLRADIHSNSSPTLARGDLELDSVVYLVSVAFGLMILRLGVHLRSLSMSQHSIMVVAMQTMMKVHQVLSKRSSLRLP